jgi:2-amino-4-hydroxy-6-hydroxymethyldihydropteridine diphosphokinase
MTKIFLGLGSNLGNKEENIKKAIEELSKIFSSVKVAPLYISKAWGVTEQPDFINTAVSAETDSDPEDLLKTVKDIEKIVGRVETFRWGPREIDIDILLYGDQVFTSENLQIPHAGIHERDTVLVPLLELDGDLVHPVLRLSLKQILNDFPEEKRSIVKQI